MVAPKSNQWDWWVSARKSAPDSGAVACGLIILAMFVASFVI